jgi:hypothetical protein
MEKDWLTVRGKKFQKNYINQEINWSDTELIILLNIEKVVINELNTITYRPKYSCNNYGYTITSNTYLV